MTQPVQKWIATAAFGAALATTVAPQLLAAQSPTVAPIAHADAEPAAVEGIAQLDGAIDMNHWQETAKPMSPIVPVAPPPAPYVKGVNRKK